MLVSEVAPLHIVPIHWNLFESILKYSISYYQSYFSKVQSSGTFDAFSSWHYPENLPIWSPLKASGVPRLATIWWMNNGHFDGTSLGRKSRYFLFVRCKSTNLQFSIKCLLSTNLLTLFSSLGLTSFYLRVFNRRQ